MRLLTQLTLAGVMLGIAGLVTSLALVNSTSTMEGLAARLTEAVESVHAAEQTERALLVHSRQSILFRSTGREEYRRVQEEARRQIAFWLESMHKFASSAHERALLKTATDQVALYLQESTGLESRPTEQDELDSLDTAQATLAALVNLNYEQSQGLKDLIEAQDRRATIIGIAAASGVTLLLVGVFLLLHFGLRRPLIHLKQRMQVLEAGFLVPIPPKGPAELQEITNVFNDLARRVKEQRESQLRFLAGVAHDLRTPLNAMKLGADTLTEDATMEDLQIVSEMISRQVSQLERQVGDLLDTSRIEAGNLDLRLAEHNLTELTENTVMLFKGTSPRHLVRVAHLREPVVCRCDSTRIGQVLTNLISNAIKYSPSGGDITVELTPGAKEVSISVKDEGIGISEEDLPRVFEPFRRTASTRETIPGIGLGLSVSKRIAEAHGGQIVVSSKPGAGSTFTLRLPCG